jgi:glycosyltransferase involved in cell wall biosynthesis
MSDPVNIAKIFIVIPAFNEQTSLRAVAKKLLALHYEVVVVDDGSENELKMILSDLPVYLLRHEVNLGQGAALQTGIEFAIEQQADYIVTFDADGQHDAADVEKLLAPLYRQEVEMTMGSRFLPGASHNMASSRRMLLQAGRYINYFFTGLLLSDTHNGLRAMTSLAAGKIHLRQNRMAHATEILLLIRKHKISFREIPVNITYSAYSTKKGQSAFSSVRIVFDLILNKFFK